jgi:hypothetical protein
MVTKSETLPEHISSVDGAKKHDPITLACVDDYGRDRKHKDSMCKSKTNLYKQKRRGEEV